MNTLRKTKKRASTLFKNRKKEESEFLQIQIENFGTLGNGISEKSKGTLFPERKSLEFSFKYSGDGKTKRRHSMYESCTSTSAESGDESESESAYLLDEPKIVLCICGERCKEEKCHHLCPCSKILKIDEPKCHYKCSCGKALAIDENPCHTIWKSRTPSLRPKGIIGRERRSVEIPRVY